MNTHTNLLCSYIHENYVVLVINMSSGDLVHMGTSDLVLFKKLKIIFHSFKKS
jgi:hypothetical protein